MSDMTQDAQRQFDYMVSKFQETIKKFDESEKVNRAIQQEYQDFKELVKGLEAKFDALSSDVSNSIKVLNNAILEQARKNEIYEACHLKISSAYDSLKNDVQNLSAESVTLLNKIQGCAFSMVSLEAKIEAVDQKYASIPGAIAKLDDPVNSCCTEVTKLKNIILEDESLIKDIKVMADKNAEDFAQLSKDFGDFQGTYQGYISALQGNHSQLVQAMPKLIADKIAEIPQPVIPSLDEIKQEFKAQLEPAALDAANACIRSKNTESKINLLDKRIEQVNLLLKKLELQA